ncbi:hypothetical protein GCM10010212_26300 [Paenarthrobacter nicotinovorans]|nr:hypothetical protein GCM10010212_26300 [Paenarthrobacter nicotinovorans]
MDFHCQKQLFHDVQLFRPVAFNSHPQFKVQGGALMMGPAHPGECYRPDGDRSLRRRDNGNGGPVVEPDMVRSDGFREHP